MQRIQEDIKTGQLKQMYLLYGEEDYLRKQYRDKLVAALTDEKDSMNVHFYEGKDISVGELIDLAETLPFLAERRVLILQSSGLFKSGGEKLAEYLTQPAQTANFVFVEKEVDKRSKLFKTVSNGGYAAEFGLQDEKTLKRWIAGLLKKENKQITESTADYFLTKIGTDMENIRTELEKLICYCIDRDVVTKEDIDAVCVTRISNHIFDMIAAIAAKQQKKALKLYYDLLALKEPPMRILFLIARQYQTLLLVKNMKQKGYDNRTVGEKAGLSAYVAGKYIAQAANFKISELKEAVKQCAEAEEAVKTGKMSDVMSIELLIMSVL